MERQDYITDEHRRALKNLSELLVEAIHALYGLISLDTWSVNLMTSYSIDGISEEIHKVVDDPITGPDSRLAAWRKAYSNLVGHLILAGMADEIIKLHSDELVCKYAEGTPSI